MINISLVDADWKNLRSKIKSTHKNTEPVQPALLNLDVVKNVKTLAEKVDDPFNEVGNVLEAVNALRDRGIGPAEDFLVLSVELNLFGVRVIAQKLLILKHFF